MLRAVLVLLCLQFLVWPVQAAQRVALVVGNGAYTQAGPLKNPANDARAIAGKLESLGFRVVTGIDQTMDQMRRSLYEFAQVAEGADLALFFYAGHGVQVGGQNYLLPTDAKLAAEIDLDFATIQMDLVLKQLDRAAKTKIVILDACRDNPFAAELARSMGSTRSAALGRGLAEIKASGGSLIAFATDPGNVAYDGEGSHSPFTEALLQHMDTPGLEINSLMQRVRTDVFRQTGEKQRPWTTTSLIGEVFLSDPVEPEKQPAKQTESQSAAVAAVPTVQAPQVPRSDSTLEIAVWQAAEAGGTAEDFQAYLDQFPEGAFSGLARTRIDRLATAGGQAATAQPAPQPQPQPAGPAAGTAFTEEALDLDRTDRRAIQRRLKLAGHDPSGVDGIFGPGSRRAISSWQSGAGFPITGYLDADQLNALEEETEAAFVRYQAEAARKKAAAKKNSAFRAQAYCAQTGVTGYGNGPDRDTALYNAALDCVNRGGIPNCCAYGARNLN